MPIIELITQLNKKDIRLWLEDGQLRFSAPQGVMNEAIRTTLKENKAGIIEFLQQHQTLETQSIDTVDADTLQPLSFSQERIWFLYQLQMNNPVFHLHSLFDMQGDLDLTILEHCLNQIIARHSILRTAYQQTNNGTFQQVLKEKKIQLSYTRLEQETLSADELQTLSQQEINQPFHLETGDVTRNRLIEINNKRFFLFCSIHHIATDGWSMSIMAQEIATIYNASKQNSKLQLPSLDIQYIDYAAWHRKHSEGVIFERQLDYWKKELRDITALNLAYDHPKHLQSHSNTQHSHSHNHNYNNGDSVAFTIGKTQTSALKAIAQQQQATLFMVLLSLFSAFLYRFSRQPSFCIGTPTANRMASQTEHLIGCFVNMLSIKFEHTEGQNFTDLLAYTKKKSQLALDNQSIPFEHIVKNVVSDRSLSATPIFQTLFSFQSTALNQTTSMSGIKIKAISHKKKSSPYNLSLSLNEWQDEMLAEFEYKTDLFDKKTVEGFADVFQTMIEQLIHHPTITINDFCCLSAAEKKQQIIEWNQTEKNRSNTSTIQEFIQNQAKISPDHTALVCGNSRLSYSQLNEQANQLAHYLIQQNLHSDPDSNGPDSNKPYIGVCLLRSVELVVSLLACLKAGYAYIPFDPELPPARLQHMSEDSQIDIVLTHSSLNHWLQPEGIKKIYIDQKDAWNNQSTNNPAIDYPTIKNSNTLFNIIYTSGSTGKPKGVIISQKAILNRLGWMQETYPLSDNDIILHKTPYSFDVSVWEIFWPLMFGAKVVIAKPQTHKDPNAIHELIVKQSITRMHFVPSMLNAFLDIKNLDNCQSLQQVFCSGESLLPEQAKRFFNTLPNTQLYNLYGPTEAAIDVSYHQCSADDVNISIGKPITNTQIYILDKQQQLLPRGAIGEIYIGGDNLANGYLHQPALTQTSFIDNPFLDAQPNNSLKLYKSGDLAHFDDKGNLYFHGRIDQQTNIRGFRVELSEIESRLNQYTPIKASKVITQQTMNNNISLHAFYIAAENISTVDIKRYLAKYLPDYMLPSSFTQLEDMPLTHNGKIDDLALKKIVSAQAKHKTLTRYVAPRNKTEEILANTWSELLNIEKISIHDNFFSLGGHSLIAAIAITRLKNHFNVNIPLSSMFEEPTIAAIATLIDNTQRKTQDISANKDDEEEIIL